MGEEGGVEKCGIGEEGGVEKTGVGEEGGVEKSGVGEEGGVEKSGVGGEEDALWSEQMNAFVYCCVVVRPEQCRCIQCGVGWLQRTDVCVLVRICKLHTLQVHTRAGPGFRSTSPDIIKRRAWSIPQASPVPASPPVFATNPAGKYWGRLAEKTVFGSPLRGTGNW